MQSITKEDPDSLIQSQQEIAGIKFETDEILKKDPKTDMPVCGLNISCAWPLPANLKDRYNQLYQDLSDLDDNDSLYIYPYEQTHITIATLINFKNHMEPSEDDESAIMSMVPEIDEEIDEMVKSLMLGETTHRIKPFTIELGPLELSEKAGIIPIKNPGGEIARLRSELEKLIKKKAKLIDSKIQIKSEFSCPHIIHSTILRFKKDFDGGPEFANRFLSIRSKSLFGKTTIEKLLLTVETRPYMHKGSVRRRYSLRK